MALLEITVLIPLHLGVAMSDLNETHAPFCEAPSQQALPTEVFRDFVVQAYSESVVADSSERSSNDGTSVCMRNASSKELMRASRIGSVPPGSRAA